MYVLLLNSIPAWPVFTGATVSGCLLNLGGHTCGLVNATVSEVQTNQASKQSKTLLGLAGNLMQNLTNTSQTLYQLYY